MPNPTTPYPVHGAEVGRVVVEFHQQVLESAVHRNGAVGGAHGGGGDQSAVVAAVKFLEELEGFENGFGDRDSEQVVLKGSEKKRLLKPGIKV